MSPAPDAALITASYAADFERCRLLCETVDRHVTGASHHYLLVEHRDVALFQQLEGKRRTVIDERELLPSWLRDIPDPTSLFKRRIWLSLKAPPLRGWHVQQLRRMAIAESIEQETLVYVDSDVAFLRPFDCARFWLGGKLRLFRRDGVLLKPGHDNHRIWSANAAAVLGIAAPEISRHDYISTLIAWRRSSVRDMLARIEQVSGRHWVEAVSARRKFSECMIYGRFVDEVADGAGHYVGAEEFCRVHWTGTPLTDMQFEAFVAAMSPEQVAIGMQSFIGTDLGRIRRLVAA
ncbi:hypothetical protein IG197_08860 [Aminobacter sp. SR38]|uniref:DUF6492 family protein n=1 Tax=Aminobacter sp. SR38 TaxID=2774562 RepID=UPI0017829182|nr:DUF6492 family protein [Aminobacter sp. SR38]QOF74141.1 hypothetical protein IG197_08860 [Aminobacter sp. SR38]